MNQLLFEGRTLVGIVSSIIRQDDLKVAYNRLDWERIYRIADYHKVANIVYLGVLGNRESLPDKWRERFFERYQESLLFGENYTESVREVLTWLDTRKISCTVLTSEAVRGFYQIPETADTSPLQIFLSEQTYNLAKGYLVDLGYETEQIYEGMGERMTLRSGLSIALYHKLPFQCVKYARSLQGLLENARIKDTYRSVRILTEENEFIYRLAGAAYRYAVDELTMREVLDIQMCHRAWRDQIRMDAVWKKLMDLKVEVLAEKLLRISYMWFGDKKDNYYEHLPEDMSAYDILEERLLTRGMIKHEADEQALNLEKLVQKELEKEKKEEARKAALEKRKQRREEQKRRFRWVFPDYHYMASIYPAVERIPALLPVFWIVRGSRLLWRVLRG